MMMRQDEKRGEGNDLQVKRCITGEEKSGSESFVRFVELVPVATFISRFSRFSLPHLILFWLGSQVPRTESCLGDRQLFGQSWLLQRKVFTQLECYKCSQLDTT